MKAFKQETKKEKTRLFSESSSSILNIRVSMNYLNTRYRESKLLNYAF